MKLSKKILSFLLILVMAMALFTGIAEGDQVEIDIYCTVQSSKGIDPDNLWWWSYIESRLAEQGYNVKLNVTGGLLGDASNRRTWYGHRRRRNRCRKGRNRELRELVLWIHEPAHL